MFRYVQFSLCALGALMSAGCSSETPATGGGDVQCTRGSDGMLDCTQVAAGQGQGMPAGPMGPAGAEGAAGGVPVLGGEGPGAVPVLGGEEPSAVPVLGAEPTPVANPSSTTGSVTPAPGVTPQPGMPAAGGEMMMPAAGGTVTPTPGVQMPAATGTATPPPGMEMAGGGADMPVATGSGTTPPPEEPVAPGAASLGTIQVSAGALDRDHAIVSFPFPAGKGKSLVLKDEQGNSLPLQVSPIEGNDTATFVLPSLGMGQTMTYTIEEPAAAPPAVMTAAVDGDHLFIKQGDSQVFRWTLVEDNFRGAAARDVRAGYIYPLYTPGGINVADDYAPDHPHMHGIWSAWTNTTFRGHKVDFWNGYANQGHVDLDSMEGVWNGSVHAGLIANITHTDITTSPNVDVLSEKWTVTIYKTHEGAPPYYVFDIVSTQVAITDPLVLEQYHYGGFGFRGAEEWQVGANVAYLTSEGHTRANGDGQNARWCAQYGDVNGQRGGFAAFDHPTNFRHPQGLRIHPSNPYWAFVPVTPLKGGRYTLEVGADYNSQFRIVSFDGDADAAMLDRLWADYADPAQVVVMP